MYFAAAPASVTQGFEAESNISLTHGLGVYINGSYDKATYTGFALGRRAVRRERPVALPSTPQVPFRPFPSRHLNVPADTVGHRNRGRNLPARRMGCGLLQLGALASSTSTTALPNITTSSSSTRFDEADAFVNYTLRTGGRFDQTESSASASTTYLQLLGNPTGITLANGAVTQNISANGTTYVDQFNTSGSSADQRPGQRVGQRGPPASCCVGNLRVHAAPALNAPR